MKATGIVRRIDELGRVVIPKELRRTLGLAEWDPLEFYVEGDRIIIRRYSPGCFFCGTAGIDLVDLLGKQVCPPCIKKLHGKLTVAEGSV